MKVINSKELDNSEMYSKSFEFDQGIQIDSFIEIAKQFLINNGAILSKCKCFSCDENGFRTFDIFYNIDEIVEMKESPDPYVKFYASFCDENTKEYKFDLSTSTNSNVLVYSVDKKRIKIYSEGE